MTAFGTGQTNQPGNGDGTTAHAVNLTTFDGEDWTYNVICTNSNPSGQSSSPVSVHVQQNQAPPPPTLPPPPTAGLQIASVVIADAQNNVLTSPLPSNTQAVNILVNTNVGATCTISGVAGSAPLINSTPTSLWVTITDLFQGFNDNYSIICQNQINSTQQVSYTLPFAVQQSTTAVAQFIVKFNSPLFFRLQPPRVL